MVSGSRIEGGPQVLSAGVRRTIQSLKEIVGDHSDADIYVALKETNMDPNETAQKLLNQDPFHEVKRKRDRKKENSGNKSYGAAEPRKNTELARIPAKYGTYFDRNARRGGSGRNAASDAGASREFRVVRDNRTTQSSSVDSKPAQSSTSKREGVISSGSMKSNSSESSGHQKPLIDQNSSQALNSLGNSQHSPSKDSTSGGSDRREMLGERRSYIPISSSRVQTKANGPQPHFTNSSSTSVAGVYSSSSDPVHVPSPHSRPAANIGAIRREVGVVGPRRLSSENSAKPSSSQGTSLLNIHSGQDGHSRQSGRQFNAASKSDHSGQNMAPESSTPGLPVNRSFSSNQHGNKTHQLMGHSKAPQPNMEWKPKSIAKPSANCPGVIGSPAKAATTVDNPEDLKKQSAQMQDNMSQLNLSESQNVIIAAHIRVSETDRCQLTFGSLGTDLDASINSICTTTEGVEELSTEPSESVSASVQESSGDEPAGSRQLEMMEDSARNSGSNSPESVDVSDHQLTEKNVPLNQQNLDDYAEVGLVRDNGPSYTPEPLPPPPQDTSELPSLSGYDPQMGYDMSYFRPIVDETVRAGLSSSREVLGTHATNTIPTSTIAMVQQQQQQQQQLAQMYPQLHVSHFANLMPYRQFLSPVYVPPMPVPGYSNNPPYPHPSNGSSYVLMPGNSSHLTPSGVKYGIQQFKPVQGGGQTAFGNFTSPAGYAINTPGVGSAAGHDDSSRLKYKDNLYVPNPQAETSEIWMSPRDLPGMQSASYYNMPGQTPHPAYLTSHSGHASFSAAAAVAQSSHMQFPGMYHPPPQPAAIASPHHLGPAIGGNVGVGVAAPAPGAQVGAYQQPQLGHFNWTGNF